MIDFWSIWLSSGHLRVKHIDGDFGGGADGAEVRQEGVAIEDVGAVGPRRLNQNLMRRSRPLPQRPLHIRQLLLQTSTFYFIQIKSNLIQLIFNSIQKNSRHFYKQP